MDRGDLVKTSGGMFGVVIEVNPKFLGTRQRGRCIVKLMDSGVEREFIISDLERIA